MEEKEVVKRTRGRFQNYSAWEIQRDIYGDAFETALDHAKNKMDMSKYWNQHHHHSPDPRK